jgi:hypothetical protein
MAELIFAGVIFAITLRWISRSEGAESLFFVIRTVGDARVEREYWIYMEPAVRSARA